MVNKSVFSVTTVEISLARYEDLVRKETLLATIINLVRKGLGWSTIQGLVKLEEVDGE